MIGLAVAERTTRPYSLRLSVEAARPQPIAFRTSLNDTRPSPTSTPGLASTKSLRSYPLAERIPYCASAAEASRCAAEAPCLADRANACRSNSWLHTHIALALRRSCSQTRPRACSRRPGLRPQAPGASPNRQPVFLAICAWSLLFYPPGWATVRRASAPSPCGHSHKPPTPHRSCLQTRPRACSRRPGLRPQAPGASPNRQPVFLAICAWSLLFYPPGWATVQRASAPSPCGHSHKPPTPHRSCLQTRPRACSRRVAPRLRSHSIQPEGA